MKKTMINKIICGAKNAQDALRTFTPEQRARLEKTWDIEHAYYSSVLEGSKLDRKEFEKLGEKIS